MAAPSAVAVASTSSVSAPLAVAPSSSGKRKAGSPDTTVGEDTELEERQVEVHREHKLAKIDYDCVKVLQEWAKNKEVELKNRRDDLRNELTTITAERERLVTTTDTRERELVLQLLKSWRECATKLARARGFLRVGPEGRG